MSNLSEELEPTSFIDLLPRLPLAIILITLLANSGLALHGQWLQHQSLAAAQVRMESPDAQKALAQGQMIEQKLSDLVHAVTSLAATDPEAQKIVNEFHIPVNVGAPAGK